MTERPGARDPAERRTTDRPGKGVDVVGDLQRWFIRQTAKNMRREISGQVRRTFGAGQTNSDVWDTATNEIPPEVGESPECQWCPICRAARRMRDSGPGIGGQLSGAGDVVTSAVQDAIGALDSLLAKASGSGPTRDSAARGNTAWNGPGEDSSPRSSAPRESASSGTSGASDISDISGTSSGTSADAAAASWPGSGSQQGATAPEHQHGTSGQPGRDGTAPDSRRERHGPVGLPGGGDSEATESTAGSAAHVNGSGPGGQPADWFAAAEGSGPDPWGAATESAEGDQDTDADDYSDGPGHGPDDRS
jgi:hypothetical protein